MEFGASFPDEVIYMGDATNGSGEERELFIARAAKWIDTKGLRLGEGAVKYMQFSQGPPCWQLRAPRIKGPDDLVERIDKANTDLAN